MNIAQKFLEDVENFLSQTGMDATSFGREAMKDPSFVFEIRAGRSCSVKTVERVYAWMASHTAEAA